MNQLIWIADGVALAIHHRQIAEHGGLEGIRDEGLLESALSRPQNLLAYSESPPDMASLAAAYAYGIVKNHPFVDGNKRTAYVVTRTFLRLNGYDLQASSQEKYQIWIDLAVGKLSEEELSEELAQQIRQLEEKVYKNAETIGDKYPEIAELFETKPTDIAQLQKNIAPDTLVIQPVPLRDKVALFLVTREKLIVIQSDTKRDELNKLVSEYRSQLADDKNADWRVTSSKLYEVLIRPIESQIATSSPKNIAIIATEQLRYIPFETLYDKKNKQVLLKKYPIYYLTRISTSSLATQKTKTDRSTLKALALANPKPFLFDTEKKEKVDLKGTEIEAETISKIFPGSEKYLGTNATLDIFKKQAFRFSILHLGTHGCFKRAGCPNLDMQANTILFANKEQYNIADAALLGLKNTELITLSACQTAKEANADGQEISGLAYVLERAGAKSVIASLWNAPDGKKFEDKSYEAINSIMMAEFYQNLQKGMSKSASMREAKLSLIEKYPHPYFWSLFILIGDAN
ncbi:MAG: type II toxin-antitoxin system death-on-curing family toxin [Microcystis sp. M048S1]|uniref:CHAT domain-containing protein n=1 Tax=unclassified Microcystis TaxID=2643300 RepID=UPI0011961E4E|nr:MULTISPECIES: type II toxin-antitoxin system death-on-curing family toxin [unclassified Microcystis]MCA2902362.1 type II toxin-antitoxin system death-on-curing family toxin [Microcystis sp. M035S1]MCA2723519.1 type II toxin-antitoxin system death-on-curing family toxin [Microcystis sp. M176S2]MCA2725071.1 type II toxin-antitoxin system death-on-curing family toxin [Microcystis sp. M166S2]MCA2730695.1 type II toxin-antitoxin system death-on-curing family toxin [Microcystis sp. M162S2]MCA2745